MPDLGMERLSVAVHTGNNPLCDDSYPNPVAQAPGLDVSFYRGDCTIHMGFSLGEVTVIAKVDDVSGDTDRAASVALAGIVRFVLENADRLKAASAG